jgi:hypothetical protein
MTRLTSIAAAALLLVAGCASSPVTDATEPGDRPPVLPASALPRMTGDLSAVDADDLANEVTHPDDLRAMLDDAGFSAAAQRSFGGGTGSFSRVIARGIAFDTVAGAADFVAWFGDHAPQEFITSERISPATVPGEVVVFHHRPDGCCHNDVPVFLAAWQRGTSVLFLHAGGRRANAGAFADLIATYDREV